MTKKTIFVCCLLLGMNATLADVKVVDLSQNATNNNDPSVTSSALSPQELAAPMDQTLTMDQRVDRLETQVNNLVQMDLSQQISQLQQQVQSLTGQLQVQQHDLDLLNQQQRNFYQDLDQRLSNLKALVTNGSDSGSSDTSNNPSTSSNSTTPTTATKKESNSDSVSDNSSSSNAADNVMAGQESKYQAAFALLTAKKYNQALSAFQQYLTTYPNGTYVANAHYWRGEIYSLLNNNKQAIAEFNTVVNNYPKSDKVADSKFKLAVIDLQSGNVSAAKTTFQQLVKTYPGSTVARLASMQLEQIQ